MVWDPVDPAGLMWVQRDSPFDADFPSLSRNGYFAIYAVWWMVAVKAVGDLTVEIFIAHSILFAVNGSFLSVAIEQASDFHKRGVIRTASRESPGIDNYLLRAATVLAFHPAATCLVCWAANMAALYTELWTDFEGARYLCFAPCLLRAVFTAYLASGCALQEIRDRLATVPTVTLVLQCRTIASVPLLYIAGCGHVQGVPTVAIYAAVDAAFLILVGMARLADPMFFRRPRRVEPIAHGKKASLGECVICTEQPVSVALVPCGHTFMCEKCSDCLILPRLHGCGSAPKCSLCRLVVTGILPLFISDFDTPPDE